MISSYLLLKLVQRSRALRSRSVEDKPTINQDYENYNNFKEKCRICLQTGLIPIFGDDNHSDISDAVRLFGNIEMKRDDNLPKLLCDACHKLLQAAVMFRSSALETDVILRQSVTVEHNENISENDSESQSEADSTEDTKIKSFFKAKKKKKYHCKVCFIDFTSLDEYYYHVTTIEHKKQKMNPNIECHICNKTLRRYYFKQHLDLHKSDKLYKVKCKVCKQSYKKGEYKKHLASHSPQATNYICEVCGRSFLRRNVYKCHLQTHSTEFPFECEFCPYRGRNSGLLKVHMRTHTGDYRYQCKECSARFLTSSNLNRHMAKHRGRNFECDTCKRKFYSKHELEQHFKVDHLGIKEHICNVCGKAFGYRNAMKKHQLHVHKREKFLDGKGRMPAYLEAERNKDDEMGQFIDFN